jgi:hypothetical protein
MQLGIRAHSWCFHRALAALFVAAILTGPGAMKAAEGPTVTGPITSGSRPNAFMASIDDLTKQGYTEQEFFLEGSAEGKLKPDDPVSSQPYKIRILVRRPMDSKRFNGTVFVEWFAGALGYDTAPSWPILSDSLVHDGYAWVGVSVLPVGINFLRKWDAQRYGSLAHPGAPPARAGSARGNGAALETYSDAMFSQVAMRLRHPSDVEPLRGLKVQRLLGYAFSAGALRLASYVNATQPREHAYDGFLLQAVMMPVEMGDVGVPIFVLNSENEVSRYLTNRQADSTYFREWEVAGTGHLPLRFLNTLNKLSQRDQLDFHLGEGCDLLPGIVSMEYVAGAALYHLNQWVKTGKEPPHAPVVQLESGKPATVARDKFGNALGGIRLPFIEVPTGKYVAIGTPAACVLVPGFVPFDAATLASLYPNHKSYVTAVSRAADRAVKKGFLLDPDGKTLREEAAASAIGEK